MELLKIETYNDGINTVHTVFRKLWVNNPEPGSVEKPEIVVGFQDQHAGPAGNFSKPFTIITSDEIDQVPVYKVTPDGLDPVMIEPTPGKQLGDEGYFEPYQKTIGGFAVWEELVFKNAFMPLNVAISDVVIREKKRLRGEQFTPMFYVE